MLTYRKRYSNALLWTVLSGAVLLFYFYGYARPAQGPSAFSAWQAFAYFLSFIGSPLFFSKTAGFVLLLAFIYLTWKRYYEKNLALYSFLCFLLLTALTAAVSRSGYGVEQSLSSRYRAVPLVFISLTYIAFIESFGRLRNRRFASTIMALSVLLWAASFALLSRFVEDQAKYLTLGAVEWEAKGSLPAYVFPHAEEGVRILSESEKIRTYIPKYDTRWIEAKPEGYAPPAGIKEGGLLLTTLYRNDKGYFIEGDAGIHDKAYLVLKEKDKDKAYRFPAMPLNKPRITSPLAPRAAGSGFAVFIGKDGLPEGKYLIGVYAKAGGHETLTFSDTFLNTDERGFGQLEGKP